MVPETPEAEVRDDTVIDDRGDRRKPGGTLKAMAALLVLLLPLAVGAGYLWGSNSSIANSWGSQQDDVVAAPGAGGMNVDVNQIQDVRRNLGAAGTEAGFAKLGAGSAKEGAVELEKGAKSAKDGSKELADGMGALQNGTGELGRGAKSVSDGVTTMVDGLTGLVAAQTAVLGAIEQADTALKDSKDPKAPQLRKDLGSVKKQLLVEGLDADAIDKANKLKDGAKQVSYQLNEPGAEYHDGIYTATKGAKDLNAGLAELHTGTKTLRDGLVTVDRQTTSTNQKIGDAKRAMPVPSQKQLEAAGGQTTDSENIGRVAALAPTIAVLIAALAMLGAALVWGTDWARELLRRRSFNALSRGALALGITAGVAATAAVALFAVADGFTWQRGLASVGILLLAASTAGLMTAATLRLFGPQMGRYLVIIGSIVQVGIVGVVWRTSMATEIPELAQAAAALMPLHYPTMALTAIGNAADGPLIWVGVGVLALLAVVSEAILVFVDRPSRH